MYKYIDNSEDKEYPEIKWFCYGAYEENQPAGNLHVWAEYKGKTYKRVVPAATFWPAMVDRMWGIDVHDQQKAFNVSNEIFEEDLKPLLENSNDN